MLRIPCPFCGSTRDEDEFTFSGPFERVRPADPQGLRDQQWSDYLFTRENTRGKALERWRHTFGCRQWFGIERDTVSHEIVRVFSLTDVPRNCDTTTPTEGGIHEAA
jgi:sarcosine oxidase, subunit delta